MNIHQLHHIMRAAAAISQVESFVLAGKHALLMHFADAPAEMVKSPEVVLSVGKRPDVAPLIDGSIGKDSAFHRAFGYYAHIVPMGGLPLDWEGRASCFRIDGTGSVEVLCPDPHDLAHSAALAGNPEDMEWLQAGALAGLIDISRVRVGLEDIGGPSAKRGADWLRSLSGK